MEADVLNALQSRSAYLTGGRDQNAHLIIVIPVPYEIQPWTKKNLELCVNYLLDALSSETKSNGLTVILDAQKCSWRVTRAHVRHVTLLFDKNLNNLIVIRPDAFWDKQRVENCAKAYKKQEVNFSFFILVFFFLLFFYCSQLLFQNHVCINSLIYLKYLKN